MVSLFLFLAPQGCKGVHQCPTVVQPWLQLATDPHKHTCLQFDLGARWSRYLSYMEDYTMNYLLGVIEAYKVAFALEGSMVHIRHQKMAWTRVAKAKQAYHTLRQNQHTTP